VDAAAWQQAKRLIEEALSQPAADRRAFVESSCRDAALRREVEAMLETYETYPFVVEPTPDEEEQPREPEFNTTRTRTTRTSTRTSASSKAM
jgi:hypothetical protein